jgi:hypothetical protein
MSVRGNKRKQTRSFQLESLEDRNLLSAAISSNVAAQVQPMKVPKVFTQTLTGLVTGTLKGAAPLVTIAAHGNLTVEGTTAPLTVSVSGEYKMLEVGRTSKWTLSGGTATFTDSAGDKINIKFSGSGKGIILFPFSVKGTITGGSGHFKGATGTFSATGTSTSYNLFGTFQMNVSLTVKTKAVG